MSQTHALYRHSENVLMLSELNVTNGATATGVIDRLGYSYLTLDIFSCTVAAASNRPSVLMLSGSDTTDVTAFAAIKALFGDGAQGFQIPEWHADSATQKSLKFNIDCRARKRDLNLTIVPCTTQDFLCVVNLNAAEIAPSDTTAANVRDLIDA